MTTLDDRVNGAVQYDVDGDGRPDTVIPGSIWAEAGSGLPDRPDPVVEQAADAVNGKPGTDLVERPEGVLVHPEETVTDLVPVDPAPRDRPDMGARIAARMDADRKPIVPVWLQSAEDRRAVASWVLDEAWYLARFHAVYVWIDLAKVLFLRVPKGVAQAARKVVNWAADTQVNPILEQLVRVAATTSSAQVAEMAATKYAAISKDRDRHRRSRCFLLALAAAPVLTAVALLLTVVPWWGVVVTATAAAGYFAWLGRPKDVPFFSRPVDSAEIGPKRLTSDMIEKAFAFLGIGLLNQALKPGGQGIGFPEPIRMDAGSRGWRADIDLPLGVTPDMVMAKRKELASAMRRPLGTVWPEGDPDVHEGRLILRVLHKDFAKQKQPAWPLAKTGLHDFFERYPFGWDVRGRLITLPMFEANTLIGAQPGQGKSASIRVGLAAAALDPTCELWIAELAGKGDFADFEPIAHVYINGIHDEAIEAAAQMLSDLRAECERRLTVLGTKVPNDMKPDKKVTREIANRKVWGLHPIKAVLDECQNLFKHPTLGKQAAEDAEAIIRLSRAVAVSLDLATQRPDKDSVPTGVSAQAVIRFCLRVLGQTENDMILGTSMYKNGFRATTFRHEKDAGIGLLVGGDDVPSVVRCAYLDGPAVQRIVKRAHAARVERGTITGHAAGETAKKGPDRYQIARDILAVWPAGQDRMWSQELTPLLEDTFPDRWTSLDADKIANLLAPLGIETRQLQKTTLEDGERKPRNRRGVDLHVVQAVLQDRPQLRKERD